MENLHYSLSFTHVPPGFKRGSLVILTVFKDGKLYLSRKHAYPEGIFRLLGGGIDSDESPEQAAARELKEETGLGLPTSKINHQATLSFDLTETATNQQYLFKTEVFFITLNEEVLTPSDDVDIIDSFSRDQAAEVIDKMKNLPSELVTPKKDLNSFRWSDWGAVFSIVHEYVLNNWLSQ